MLETYLTRGTEGKGKCFLSHKDDDGQLITCCYLLTLTQLRIFLATWIKIWKCTDKNDLHSGLKYWQLYGVKCHCFLGTSSLHFPLWISQPSWTAESLINVWDSNSITLNISPVESHKHCNAIQRVHILIFTP